MEFEDKSSSQRTDDCPVAPGQYILGPVCSVHTHAHSLDTTYRCQQNEWVHAGKLSSMVYRGIMIKCIAEIQHLSCVLIL